MTKKIVSFGDSFMFGSELPNNKSGFKSWAGVIASRLGYEYKTYAKLGCGNDNIAQQVFTHFSENSNKDTLAVINWTWIMRWDYQPHDANKEVWITLGPTCNPTMLDYFVDRTRAEELINFYKDNVEHSLLFHKTRNLQTMYAVQSYLKSKNIKNIQTYMDYELFEKNYHCPNYVKELQSMVEPNVELFPNNKNFLDWSRDNNFPVTSKDNPVGESHNVAANLWIDRYKDILNG
jgi:hypothetical protein